MKWRALTEELDKKEENVPTIITKMAKTDYPISELDIKKMECKSIFH